MSALDLNRLNTTIRRCAATLLDASYTDGIPTETTDVWRTIAADAARDLTALITRLRAAEARTAWQPIETAPASGWCLVLVGGRACVAEQCGWGWRDAEGNSVCVDDERFRFPLVAPEGPSYDVTNWMPLPAVPEAP